MDNEKILEIVLKARDEASKVIAGVGDQVEQSSKRVLDMTSTLKIAGGALLTMGLTGVGAMKMLADAAAEDQKAMAQTSAVLQSTKSVAGVTAEAVTKMADSLATLTPYSDTAIRSGENLLLTFTNIGSNIFPQATETMLDMSQALGQDLKNSAIQLGKALQDPTLGITALRRVGVNFNEESKTMIDNMVKSGNLLGAQTFILKELQTEFGGSAKAAGTTFAGQVQILNNRIDMLKENLGYQLLPTLTSIVEGANKIAERFSSLSPATSKAIVAFLAVGTALALIAGPILLFLGFLPAIAAGFGLISGAILPIIAVVAAVTAAAVLLYKNWGSVTSAFAQTKPYIQAVIDQLSQFWTEIQPKLEAACNAIKIKIADLVKLIKDHWDQIKIVIEVALGIIMAFVIVWWELLKTVIKVALDIISGNWKAVWEDIKGFFIGVWNDLNALTSGKLDEILKNIEKFVGDAVAKFKSMADQVTNALHQIKFPHLSIGEGDIKVAGQNIKYPKLDVSWYEQGGYVPRTGLAYLHQGEFVLSKDMLEGRKPVPSPATNIYKQPITINANVESNLDMNLLGYKLAFALRNSR